jgi:hypothetical protein
MASGYPSGLVWVIVTVKNFCAHVGSSDEPPNRGIRVASEVVMHFSAEQFRERE